MLWVLKRTVLTKAVEHNKKQGPAFGQFLSKGCRLLKLLEKSLHHLSTCKKRTVPEKVLAPPRPGHSSKYSSTLACSCKAFEYIVPKS